MIKICPRCQERYITDKNNTDFVHECNSGTPVLDEEDVLDVVNTWTDYTGTGKANAKNSVKGIPNELFGTRAWLEGEENQGRTVHGRSVDIYRTRQHLEFINNENRQ